MRDLFGNPRPGRRRFRRRIADDLPVAPIPGDEVGELAAAVAGQLVGDRPCLKANPRVRRRVADDLPVAPIPGDEVGELATAVAGELVGQRPCLEAMVAAGRRKERRGACGGDGEGSSRPSSPEGSAGDRRGARGGSVFSAARSGLLRHALLLTLNVPASSVAQFDVSYSRYFANIIRSRPTGQ